MFSNVFQYLKWVLDMKRYLNKWIICLMIIGLALGFTSCGREEPIRIGFIAGLSGRVADLGVAGRNGVILAIDQKNAQGGIKGRNLELIVRDDQQNPDTAQRMVKELLDLKVDLIIGPMTSSMAMATVSLVNDSKIYMVSPTASTTALSNKDDHLLRVISSTNAYAIKSALYQFDNLGRRKAVVIYDSRNKSYTQDWLNHFKTTFENLGGSIVKSTSFHSGSDVSFYGPVKELLESDPDLFLIITNAVDAALICQQVRKLDQKLSIAMAEWASTERFIELGGTAAEGVYVSQFLDRNDTSAPYQNFRNTFHERFGREPGFAGLAGYDTGLVIIEALSRQKKDETIKEAIIQKKSFQGLQQVITINRFGDADRTTFITKIKNGQYVTLE